MIMTNNAAAFARQAEFRLYAYKDLRAKLHSDVMHLNSLKRENQQHPNIKTLHSAIKESVRELTKIEDAVKSVLEDYYGEVMTLRYFERKTDEQIAELLSCDVSTVRRNRKRLLKRIAVRIFGAAAIETD